MKKILRTHYSIVLISLLFAVGCAAAAIFFFQSIQKEKHRVIDARDRLASFEINKRTFIEEAKELEGIQHRITALEQNVMTEESIPRLLSSLEAMAEKYRIEFTITSVEQEGPNKTSPNQLLHIDFSATGSFANIEQFVSSVQMQPYQVRFSNFSLYASDTAAADGQSWQLLAGIDIVSM